MRVTAAALLAALLLRGARASKEAALGSVLSPAKPGRPHLVDSVYFSTLAGGDAGGSALAAVLPGPAAGKAMDVNSSGDKSGGGGSGSSDSSSNQSGTSSGTASDFGSSTLPGVPGVDSSAGGAAQDTLPGLAYPASPAQGTDDGASAAGAQEAFPDSPNDLLGMSSSVSSGAAWQLKEAPAPHLAVTAPEALARLGRRLRQGDPRVDQFAYGGYGGVPAAPASAMGMIPTTLGSLGSRRRLAQGLVNPGQIPSNPFQNGSPNAPGLPDLSPFVQGGPRNPAVKGAYGGGGRRRLQAGLPDIVSISQLPVSSTEGNMLRRRRRVRSAPAADPNPVRDAPALENPPTGRRLAQFVPLHGGSSGVDSGVVAPGLFRPSGSYSRRR